MDICQVSSWGQGKEDAAPGLKEWGQKQLGPCSHPYHPEPVCQWCAGSGEELNTPLLIPAPVRSMALSRKYAKTTSVKVLKIKSLEEGMS